MSDKDIALREGTWFTEEDLVHPIINTNLDVYYLDDLGQETLLLKYRKNQISDELCELEDIEFNISSTALWSPMTGNVVLSFLEVVSRYPFDKRKSRTSWNMATGNIPKFLLPFLTFSISVSSWYNKEKSIFNPLDPIGYS